MRGEVIPPIVRASTVESQGAPMDSLISLAWVIAAAVVGVPLIVTVVRPLAWALVRGWTRRRSPPTAVHPAADGEGNALLLPAPAPNEDKEEIDTARAEASIEASALKRFREHVDAHPDKTYAVLRNWLHAA